MVLKTARESEGVNVDDYIRTSLSGSITPLEDILRNSPGIYPSIIMESIIRQGFSNRVQFSSQVTTGPFRQEGTAQYYKEKDRRAPPHPLDFDWRFSPVTTKDLHEMCLALSQEGDEIVMLGTPTLFSRFARNHSRRLVTLADINDCQLGKPMPEGYRSLHVDLRYCALDSHHARLSIVDPPWYLDYTLPFLWHASNSIEIGGVVLMTKPKEGTRVGIEDEWKAICNFAGKVGLAFSTVESLEVRYETPYFEANALKASGLTNIPTDWRSAELAVFRKTNSKLASFPSSQIENSWTDVGYGVRVKLQDWKPGDFTNPYLETIVPGGILPTVSRRAPERKLADVWTAGNRIFSCGGTSIFSLIMKSIGNPSAIRRKIEAHLDRRLSDSETAMVNSTHRQILRVLQIESLERNGR